MDLVIKNIKRKDFVQILNFGNGKLRCKLKKLKINDFIQER